MATVAVALIAAAWGCGEPAGPPGVGDSITLRGERGERVEVTLARVIDPLRDVRDPASPGLRRVGIELVLRNLGGVTLQEAPASGGAISTTGGEEPQLAFVTSGVCGGGFAGAVVLEPGARQRGCIPFEVGRTARLRSFGFRLDPEAKTRPGRWRLGR
ncbi:MAG: hypothetical protein ACJ76S_07010 [Solirubrobacteraceae bacterium]